MSQKKSIVSPMDQLAEVPNEDSTEVLFPFGRFIQTELFESERTELVVNNSESAPVLDDDALRRAMTTNRRSEPRVPFACPTLILDREGRVMAKGKARNISMGGFGVQITTCNRRIVVGQIFTLEVFGNKKLKPFRAEAEILNFSMSYRRVQRCLVGLRWISMSNFVSNMIAEYAEIAGGTLGGFDYTEKV